MDTSAAELDAKTLVTFALIFSLFIFNACFVLSKRSIDFLKLGNERDATKLVRSFLPKTEYLTNRGVMLAKPVQWQTAFIIIDSVNF